MLLLHQLIRFYEKKKIGGRKFAERFVLEEQGSFFSPSFFLITISSTIKGVSLLLRGSNLKQSLNSFLLLQLKKNFKILPHLCANMPIQP